MDVNLLDDSNACKTNEKKSNNNHGTQSAITRQPQRYINVCFFVINMTKAHCQQCAVLDLDRARLNRTDNFMKLKRTMPYTFLKATTTTLSRCFGVFVAQK